MFDTYLMIRTDDRTLEQTPDAFDAVGVNVADNPFFGRMINPTMLRVGIFNSPISWHFVRVDRFRFRRSVVVNELVKNDFSSVRDNLQANLTFALHCANGDSF